MQKVIAGFSNNHNYFLKLDIANFYDNINKYCNENQYSYSRYADDQIIGFSKLENVYGIISKCAEELKYINLNLNSSKVKIFNKVEFNNSWGFEIMDMLNDKTDIKNISKAVELFLDVDHNKLKSSGSAILKRILNSSFDKISECLQKAIINIVIKKDEFILSCDPFF